VYYRTEGSSEGYRVNVVGVWEPGRKEPLWVMGEAFRGKRGVGWRKWRDYSGLFLLLKAPGRFPLAQWREALGEALQIWRRRVLPP
jgi:hypothetical protein